MVKRNAEGADRGDGGGITQAGWYHFVVEEAEENDNSAKLVCQVVAGEHPDEKDRKLTHFVNFYSSDPNDAQKQRAVNKMMFNWGEALGLEEKTTNRIFTQDVRHEMVESSADVELDFNEAQSHQFVAKVEMEPYRGNDPEKKKKYEGREFPRIAFDVYHPLHDKVKDVPKDAGFMKLFDAAAAGGNGGGANGASPGNGQGEPATAAASPQSNDDWGVF